MAALRKSSEMDGLALVRAVRHAREEGYKAPPPVAESSAPTTAKPVGKPAARIGRTALPTKHEIFCYACGYTFQSVGKVQTLYCAKCRTILEQKDFVVEGESVADFTTTGSIRLGPGAVLKGGALTARDVVVAGRMEGGSIKAFRRLEVEPGATLMQERVVATDLRIAPGASLKLKGRVLFRNVEVAGELNVNLACSGLLTVRSSGHFRGRLQGAHLLVEEGGGLNGDFRVEPPAG